MILLLLMAGAGCWCPWSQYGWGPWLWGGTRSWHGVWGPGVGPAPWLPSAGGTQPGCACHLWTGLWKGTALHRTVSAEISTVLARTVSAEIGTHSSLCHTTKFSRPQPGHTLTNARGWGALQCLTLQPSVRQHCYGRASTHISVLSSFSCFI